MLQVKTTWRVRGCRGVTGACPAKTDRAAVTQPFGAVPRRRRRRRCHGTVWCRCQREPAEELPATPLSEVRAGVCERWPQRDLWKCDGSCPNWVREADWAAQLEPEGLRNVEGDLNGAPCGEGSGFLGIYWNLHTDRFSVNMGQTDGFIGGYIWPSVRKLKDEIRR